MAKKRPMKKGTVKPATYPKLIDYTEMPVGTIVSQWTYRDKEGNQRMACSRIAVCPKCGRPGEERIYKNKAGEETGRGYHHKSEIREDIPGFPLSHITDHCSVSTKPTGEQAGGVA